MMNPLLTVESAEYVQDYTLRIRFSNGETRCYDFSREYDRGICVKLKDKDYFRNFTIDPFTIDWNNEIGFAPEYLYANGMLTNVSSNG